MFKAFTVGAVTLALLGAAADNDSSGSSSSSSSWSKGFVQREGTQLKLDGRPFYFVGAWGGRGWPPGSRGLRCISCMCGCNRLCSSLRKARTAFPARLQGCCRVSARLPHTHSRACMAETHIRTHARLRRGQRVLAV